MSAPKSVHRRDLKNYEYTPKKIAVEQIMNMTEKCGERCELSNLSDAQTEDGHAMVNFEHFSFTPTLKPKHVCDQSSYG